MVARLLGAAVPADARPRRRRARGRDLRPQPGAAARARRLEPPRAGGGGRVIALISGAVAVRRADHVVIDCGGVGYRLAVSGETLAPGSRGRQPVDAAHAPGRPRRRAAAVRLRDRGGARPVPDAAGRPVGRAEGRARGALRRRRRASCSARSRPATAPASRRPRGSASARPSGSSSSCARRCGASMPAARRRSRSAARDDPLDARARGPDRSRLQRAGGRRLLDGRQRRAAPRS